MSKDDGSHRQAMMDLGGVGVFLNAFRDGGSGGETQWLGLLGLCNLAVRKRMLILKISILSEIVH